METVYVLTGVERGAHEIYASQYDIHCLPNAATALLYGEKPHIDPPPPARREAALFEIMNHPLNSQPLNSDGLLEILRERVYTKQDIIKEGEWDI